MEDLDANIKNYSQPSTPTPIPTPIDTLPPVSAGTTSTPPSGVSTIEESTKVVNAFAPAANFPVLGVPDMDANVSVKLIGIMSKDNGDALIAFFKTQQLAESDIINRMLDNWNNSIKEEEKKRMAIINNPLIIALEQLRLHPQNDASSTTTVNAISTTPVTSTQHTQLISPLERLKDYGKLSPTVEITEPNNKENPFNTITIPFMATIIVGGAVAVGVFEMSVSPGGMSSTPFSSPAEIVNRFQFLGPELIQNALPIVNLLVMPLIYNTSWEVLIGNMKTKEKDNNLNLARSFAEKTIKIVGDSDFIMVNLVNKLINTEKLSPEEKNKLIAVVKFMLASLALCLLYSVEVGKVRDGKFWGMEPKEFQGLLNGTIEIPDPTKGKLSKDDQLKYTLIRQIKSQMDALPKELIAKTIETLFEYLTHPHNIDDMLDPLKVLSQLFESSQFDNESPTLETAKA